MTRTNEQPTLANTIVLRIPKTEAIALQPCLVALPAVSEFGARQIATPTLKKPAQPEPGTRDQKLHAAG
jgi:hypothetical protein